ncbi:hypothetical protein LOTGIDRAFT_195125, partial [Lottia gigantea]
MLQFGYQKAFGLLFVKFLEEFQAPVSFTSIILGLFEAITSLASLFIMGVLLDYWSIRVYGILGALLSATGVALSAFAMSVEYLIFSHSVLVGIGYAFSFGPMFVLISRHFKKRRGLAFAISSAGVTQENGLSEYQSSVLLSVIGALDVIFRIVPGIIIEFRIVKAQHIVIFSLIVLGTVFQFISFFNDFATLMVLSCLYGIFGGSYFTLLAVILIDIMNIDNFGKIFGFVQIFHGVSSFVIFPAAGGLKDLTGTYTSCFQFLGACLLLSSIILLFEPLVKK